MANKKTFFISDTHFNHKHIIEYCKRPFTTIEEMNEVMIQNWNRVVSRNDIVYHLGDVSWGTPDQYLQKLNGYKILIQGNHDKYSVGRAIRGGFREVYNLKQIKLGDIPTILCHFPMYSWNKSHRGSYHLHGHIHEKKIHYQWNRCNVSADVINFTPISSDELIAYFKKEREEKNLTFDVL